MTNKRRWIMALCAVGIHICIGSIYAWSQIASQIEKEYSGVWSLSQITLTFSIAIVCLGLAAAFMGRFVEKQGPKVSGIISAILFCVSIIGSSIALKYQNLWLLYIAYGAIGGFSIGLGYITPVSILLRWFPNNRGLAMGITIMGFGFGAAIMVFLLQNVLPWLGIKDISQALIIIGIIYFIIMLSSSLYLQSPEKDYHKQKKHLNSSQKQNRRTINFNDVFASQAIKTTRFYLLWIMLFINVSCGIALISVAKFMGKEVIMLSSQMAAIMLVLMSIFNGVGRIGWATLSDYITRPITYAVLFIIQIVAFYFLTIIKQPMVFQLLVFLILTCYGGGFAMIPAYVGDIFGTMEAGIISGYILTAWSLAGIVGPMLITISKDLTGSYIYSLYIFIGFLVVGLLVSLMAIFNINKCRQGLTTKPVT